MSLWRTSHFGLFAHLGSLPFEVIGTFRLLGTLFFPYCRQLGLKGLQSCFVWWLESVQICCFLFQIFVNSKWSNYWKARSEKIRKIRKTEFHFLSGLALQSQVLIIGNKGWQRAKEAKVRFAKSYKPQGLWIRTGMTQLWLGMNPRWFGVGSKLSMPCQTFNILMA